jgi:hypothetical protein
MKVSEGTGGEKIYDLGDIMLWVDKAGVIMIKTMEPSGDPVELNEHEALALSGLLRQLAAQLS